MVMAFSEFMALYIHNPISSNVLKLKSFLCVPIFYHTYAHIDFRIASIPTAWKQNLLSMMILHVNLFVYIEKKSGLWRKNN